MTRSRTTGTLLAASVASATVAAGLTFVPVDTLNMTIAGIPAATVTSNGTLALSALAIVLLIAAVLTGLRTRSAQDSDDQDSDDQPDTEPGDESSALTDKDTMNSSFNSFSSILEMSVLRSDAALEPAPLTSDERKEAKAAAAAEKKRAAREAKFTKAAEKQAAKAAKAAEKAARRGKHAMNTDLIEDETGTGWARSYEDQAAPAPVASPADPTWVTDAYNDPSFVIPFDSTEWISAADDANARIAALTETLTAMLAEAEAAAAADQAEFAAMLDTANDAANQAQADLTAQISTLRERSVGLHAHLDELRAELAQTERELTAVDERATEAETALAAARVTFTESVAAIAAAAEERFVSRLDRLRGIASARADLDDVIVAAIDNMSGTTRSDATAIQSTVTDAPE